MYVADGYIPLIIALGGCVVRTFLGDMFWFFLGRLFGAASLQRPPICWITSPRHIASARLFFEKHGPTTLLFARFAPMIRTPVQVTAGVFSDKSKTCVVYLAISVLIYAPVLVIGSGMVGRAVTILPIYQQYGQYVLVSVAICLWLILVAVRFAVRQRASRASPPPQ